MKTQWYLLYQTITKTAKDTEYSITNSDWLESDGRYYVEAYSMSVNSVISDVVIVKYNLNDLPLDYHPSIVKDVFECINSDGERTAGITVENEQSERTLIAVTSDIVNKAKSINSSDLNEYQVEKGDVIKYALNTLGEISAVQVIYKYSTDAILSTLTASSSTVFNNGRVVKGYIYNVENDFISVAFEDLSGYASDHVVQASDCEIYNSSEFKIICVYERNGKLYFDDGYISNLKSFRNNGNASKVIVYTDNGNGKFMIVLE